LPAWFGAFHKGPRERGAIMPSVPDYVPQVVAQFYAKLSADPDFYSDPADRACWERLILDERMVIVYRRLDLQLRGGDRWLQLLDHIENAATIDFASLRADFESLPALRQDIEYRALELVDLLKKYDELIECTGAIDNGREDLQYNGLDLIRLCEVTTRYVRANEQRIVAMPALPDPTLRKQRPTLIDLLKTFAEMAGDTPLFFDEHEGLYSLEPPLDLALQGQVAARAPRFVRVLDRYLKIYREFDGLRLGHEVMSVIASVALEEEVTADQVGGYRRAIRKKPKAPGGEKA
jgi:hypothetical protein